MIVPHPLPSGLPPIVPQLLARLSTENIQRIFLYGSRARGDAGPRSDIDLAIDAPSLSETEWNAIYDAVEQADTLYKIDCVWLQKASAPLQQNILRDGKVLYERPA